MGSILLTLSGVLWAQAPSPTLSLLDARFQLDRLAPGEAAGEAVFVVDDATILEFDIASTVPALTTSIQGPSGEIIDETTVGSFGGEFARFEGVPGSDSTLISPLSAPGFHFFYRFSSVGPGAYTVRFNATAVLTQDEAVFTQLTTNSPLVVGLVAPDSEVVLSNLAVLTAAIFEGSEPLGGASAEVTVRDPVGTYLTFSLLDDGVEEDNAAGDGLYSGEFEPSLAGRYSAVADITGTTSSGVSFSRQAAAEFTVVPVR
ncbi:MAG: choice-of-anchor X domain-containing protein, partial [Vicinamibacteria bacterium]